MLLKIIGIILFFSILYFSLEVIKRKLKLNKIITRKIAHFTSAFFIVLLSFKVSQAEFIITTSFFLIFFIFSYYKNIMTSIHIKSPRTYGEIYYPISLIILATFFYNNKLILLNSLLILGLSDTITGLYNFKISKLKSIMGSFLFFISSLLILIFMNYFLGEYLNLLIIFKIILISFTITIIEYYSTFGSDNLTVPISSALLIYLLF